MRLFLKAFGARFIDAKDIKKQSSDCAKIFPVVVKNIPQKMAGHKGQGRDTRGKYSRS
jgi:hypothetical protein